MSNRVKELNGSQKDQGTQQPQQKEKKERKKTSCPITREQFRAGAKPVLVSIAGKDQIAEVKEFSTDSLGWYATGKTVIDVGGTPVSVQVNLSLVIVGSKELPKE